MRSIICFWVAVYNYCLIMLESNNLILNISSNEPFIRLHFSPSAMCNSVAQISVVPSFWCARKKSVLCCFCQHYLSGVFIIDKLEKHYLEQRMQTPSSVRPRPGQHKNIDLSKYSKRKRSAARRLKTPLTKIIFPKTLITQWLLLSTTFCIYLLAKVFNKNRRCKPWKY